MKNELTKMAKQSEIDFLFSLSDYILTIEIPQMITPEGKQEYINIQKKFLELASQINTSISTIKKSM